MKSAKQKRAEAYALVEADLRELRAGAGKLYADELFWTHRNDDTLLDAVDAELERR